MGFRDYLPLVGLEKKNRSLLKAQPLEQKELKALPKLFKPLGLAVGYTGGTYSIGFNRVNFEPAPYDLDRIIQAIDTDSYVKQGFNKYKELFWKEGYTILSQNPEAVEYLKLRIQFMELSMRSSFNSFLVDVADQLVKFGNAFIVKVRGDLDEVFPVPLNPIYGSKPIIGYQLLPAETVEIMRDYHNRPIKYRQNIWGANGYNAPSGFGRAEKGYANLLPTWKPDEVIHLTVDCKPGRLFGTPFIVAAMDDIVALRQVEEDVQNLVHRELFPLYKYKVGTEEHPAEPDEIEEAANSIANLRVDGGLVLPDRHDVEVVGGEGKALDVEPYLNHFKERVAIGMGLSKKHLGMEDAGTTGSDDRLDIALYDKIKLYQKHFADMVRLGIFNELLIEADFDPFLAHGKTLDTCFFAFNEIDVDTQVKKENHYIQQWISDAVTFEELRLLLKRPVDADRQELYTAISNRELAPPEAPGKPVLPGGKGGSSSSSPASPSAAKKPTGGAPSTGGGPVSGKPAIATRGGTNNTPKLSGPPAISKSNRSPINKAVANKSMPTNQYGVRKSPNIRHSEDDLFLEELVDLLDNEEM